MNKLEEHRSIHPHNQSKNEEKTSLNHRTILHFLKIISGLNDFIAFSFREMIEKEKERVGRRRERL